MNRTASFANPGWLFAAGAALALVGLWRAPQGNDSDTSGSQSAAQNPLPVAANADSNNRMIAVTGTDITGASILYLVDTVNYQLAIYQAVGGGDSTQGVRFVGARRIDLDLQLQGYNDRSQYSYKKLREAFADKGLISAPPGSSPASPADLPDDPSKKPNKN